MRRPISFLLGWIVLFSGAGSEAATIVSYDFSSGFQGWTASETNTNGDPSGSSGWDPSGFIWATALPYPTARDTYVRFTAPANFIASLPQSYGGGLRFRIKAPNTTFLNFHIVKPVDSRGGSGVVCNFGRSLSDWTTVTVPLSTAGSCTIRGVGDPASGSYLQQTLQSATGFYLLGANYGGETDMWLDDVVLFSPVSLSVTSGLQPFIYQIGHGLPAAQSLSISASAQSHSLPAQAARGSRSRQRAGRHRQH